MNYREIIFEGHFNPSSRQNLNSYFKRQFLNAQKNNYTIEEFFDGCMNEIQNIENSIDQIYNSEKKELYLILSLRKRDKLKINSHVFHNAVSNKWLANYVKKKKINNKNKDEYIIYVSNFTKNKNHLSVIKNNPLFKRYKMIFVGSPIDRHGVKIRENLLKYDNVKIYSKISETRLMDLIHNSSFAIFPSNYEGFGMPILETITLQKKILISNSLKLQHFKNNPLVRKVDFKKGVKKKDIIWAKSPRKNSVKNYSYFDSWEYIFNKMIKFFNN